MWQGERSEETFCRDRGYESPVVFVFAPVKESALTRYLRPRPSTWQHLLVAATLTAATSAPALAGAISGVGVDKQTPQPGETIALQVAVSDPDSAPWAAGSYQASVQLRTADGAVIAEAGPVAGDVAANPGQTAFVFVPVQIPSTAAGPLTLRVQLAHSGTTVDDTTTAIVVGAIAAAPVPAAAAAAAQNGIRFGGDLNSAFQFASQSSQAGTFGFNGKYDGNRSFTSTFGLSTVPGQSKPIIGFQTQASILQVGTFSTGLSPEVFSGASGTGFNFKRQWSGVHALQASFISGGHATSNPFDLTALSYAMPVGAGTLQFTGGAARVMGPPLASGSDFMRNGNFLGIDFSRPANAANVTYGFRFGLVNYHDDEAGIDRADRTFGANVGFNIRKAALTLDFTRTGPFYPTLEAPGITPDRESENFSITIPMGKINVTGAINGYRDQLPGSPLTQATHNWSEALGFDYPVTQNDALSLHLTNGIQHQNGQSVNFNGNDNTSVSYTARRGVYTYALSVGSANQRAGAASLTHTVQDSFSVTRAAQTGLSGSLGVNLTNIGSSAASASGILTAGTATVGYTAGLLSLSAAVNRSLQRPAFGLVGVPTTAMNYGVNLKPGQGRPFNLSATVTQNHGTASTSTGSLNLSRSF